LRFVTFQREGYTEPGVLHDGRIVGLRTAGFNDLITLIAGGADAIDRVLRFRDNAPGSELVDPLSATLCAPVPRPPP
jgi:hypothetical protein